MQNSTLLTQGLVPEAHAHHTDHLGLTIAHIAMAFWVCLANGSQIVNIILTPAIRRQPKNILVVNVCLCEVIIGGFLCPLYSDSLLQGGHSCQILWKPKFQAVTVFVSFFCPAFVTMFMAAFMVIFNVILSGAAKEGNVDQILDRKKIKESVRVGLLSSLTSILLQFPFFIVLLQEIFCPRDASRLHQCGLSEKTWVVVMLVAMLKPGITPFVWLAYSDVRSGFRLLCWWRSERRNRRRYKKAEDALADLCRSDNNLRSSFI